MRSNGKPRLQAYVWVLVGGLLMSQPAWADRTARSDTARGIQWNTLNKNGQGHYDKHWGKDPAGSTYVLQVLVEAPASGPAVPPTSPFPIPDGAISDPKQPPGNLKFIEKDGKTVDGQQWRPLHDKVEVPPPSNAFAEGEASGQSGKHQFLSGPSWEAFAFTKAEAKASPQTPRATAWAKVYDPWDFHDYVLLDGSPAPDDRVVETAALTLLPLLDVSAAGASDFATAISATQLTIEGLELFHMNLALSEAAGIRTFASDIFFDPSVALFEYSIDDSEGLILGDSILPDEFISLVNAHYDPATGQWAPPDEGFNVLIAHELAQSPSFYLGGGHVTATFDSADRVFVQTHPVPEPAGMTLFGSGLVAFIVRRRRRVPTTRIPI